MGKIPETEKGRAQAMYCPNCGSYMQEQASFCPTCGQAVLQAPTVRGKAECARELQLILPDLRALEENYKQIGIYSQASSNAGKDMKLVIRGLCFFAFLLIASLLEKLRFIPDALCWILGIAAALLLYRYCGGFLRRNTKLEKAHYEEQKEEFVERYQECYLAVSPVLERYLPEDYWYSGAVEAVSTYLRNMRADTIKEAINLYEEELHRLRMENTAQLILIENQKQTAYAALQLFSLTAINMKLS